MQNDRDESFREFGEMFVKEVRDSTLFRYEKTKLGRLGSGSAKALHAELESLGKEAEKVIDEVVLDVVDSVLFRFLRLVEQEVISISYEGVDDINSASDGISGEIFGDDGWIALYSKYAQSKR